MTNPAAGDPHPPHFTAPGIHTADVIRDNQEELNAKVLGQMIPSLADLSFDAQHTAVHQVTRLALIYQYSTLEALFNKLNNTQMVYLLAHRMEAVQARDAITDMLNHMMVELSYCILHFAEPVPAELGGLIEAIRITLPKRELYRERRAAMDEAVSAGDYASLRTLADKMMDDLQKDRPLSETTDSSDPDYDLWNE